MNDEVRAENHNLKTPTSECRTNHFPLRMVAWEVTRACNLACIHCRASSERGSSPGELTTEECMRVMDEIASFSKPIIILTGGEPLLRQDIFDLARYGSNKGFRMVMATNGTLITEETIKAMKTSGIQRISISLDGPNAETHDVFRKMEGAFEGSLHGIEMAKKGNLEFQINTTITQTNLPLIAEILDLAVNLGAIAHHLFLLVPTGRGKKLKDQEITALDYEKTLHWIYEQKDRVPLQLKATCAPHYHRIFRQLAKKEGKKITSPKYGLDAMTRGCLGGLSFCFISHIGDVQPCGYLELNCGNVKGKNIKDIWSSSEIFQTLRDTNGYQGKCGRCEFRKICGGCRARAYETFNNFMAEEPYCIYEPD